MPIDKRGEGDAAAAITRIPNVSFEQLTRTRREKQTFQINFHPKMFSGIERRRRRVPNVGHSGSEDAVKNTSRSGRDRIGRAMQLRGGKWSASGMSSSIRCDHFAATRRLAALAQCQSHESSKRKARSEKLRRPTSRKSKNNAKMRRRNGHKIKSKEENQLNNVN